MISKESLLQYFSSLPADNNEILSDLGLLSQEYPASSTINFMYLNVLKKSNQVIADHHRSMLLLSIVDKKAFQNKSFYQHKIYDTANVEVPRENNDEIIEELIEKFSEETPKIKYDPEKHDKAINWGKSSLIEDPSLISETLANIYAQQGHISKAVKIYKKLNLIYPEKSNIFAAQILELKNRKEKD